MDARKVILTRGPGRAELVSGRTTQIFQNELEATEFRVVVHVERECDIERITRKELLLLDTFCHAPSHGTETDVATPVLRPR